MLLEKLLPASLWAFLLLATSCTVYVPMQPLMPLVSQRRQAEFGASLQPTGRLEATAAYSPVPHIVVTSGGTFAPRLGDQTFLVTRQYEVGTGLYQPLGRHLLLSALGGFGQAYCHRGYVDLGIFGPGTPSEYKASYAKYFGQVGLARTGSRVVSGFTYRLTRVKFDYLLDTELGPLPLAAMTRHELTGFLRINLGHQVATSWWQLAGAIGISQSSTPKLDDNLGYPTYGRTEYQANRNLLPAFYGSLGVVYRVGLRQ